MLDHQHKNQHLGAKATLPKADSGVVPKRPRESSVIWLDAYALESSQQEERPYQVKAECRREEQRQGSARFS